MIEPGIAMSKRHLNRHTNGQGMEKYSRQADGLSYIGIMIGAVIVGRRACSFQTSF